MARLIKGIDVILYEKREAGKDGFGSPIYEVVQEVVENVLVGSPSAEESINELNLSGKRIAFVLGIPKGDNHNWEDAEVAFFGKRFKTFGGVMQGIEELVPMDWHKKVKVELYE